MFFFPQNAILRFGQILIFIVWTDQILCLMALVVHIRIKSRLGNPQNVFFFGRMDARKPVRKHGSEMCLFITYSFGNDPFYELINVVSNINPEKNIMAQLFKDSEKIEYFVFFALETADNTDGYVPNINISTAYVFSSLITILVLGSPIQHPNQ